MPKSPILLLPQLASIFHESPLITCLIGDVTISPDHLPLSNTMDSGICDLIISPINTSNLLKKNWLHHFRPTMWWMKTRNTRFSSRRSTERFAWKYLTYSLSCPQRMLMNHEYDIILFSIARPIYSPECLPSIPPSVMARTPTPGGVSIESDPTSRSASGKNTYLKKIKQQLHRNR